MAGEVIPLNVLRFIAAQLGMWAEDLDGYAVREETRREHLADIRFIYGYRMFSGHCARDLKIWLENEAEAARSNEGLARRFVEECRRRQVILPGLSVMERLCADTLVAAERRIEARIAAGLDDDMRLRLDRLLTEEVDGGVSRFVWLRRFEVGRNSADINGLLDRLEFLQGFDLPADLLETVPPHRVARLRRQGERYFTDGLRDISGDRRLAILAVCAVEWRGAIADAVVETHDRVVGQTFRSAKRLAPKAFLNLEAQRVHAAPHVRHARRQPYPDTARNRDHRGARTASTRASAGASTVASTITRERPLSTISIRPYKAETPSPSSARTWPGGATTTGTNALERVCPSRCRNFRRQSNSRLALRSLRRATAATVAPGT